GQNDRIRGVYEIMAGVGILAEQCDSLARGEGLHVLSNGIHDAPCLVSWSSGRARILKPRTPLPRRNVRSAHTTALKTDSHLVRSRISEWNFDNLEAAGLGQHGGATWGQHGSRYDPEDDRGKPASREKFRNRLLVGCR